MQGEPSENTGVTRMRLEFPPLPLDGPEDSEDESLIRAPVGCFSCSHTVTSSGASLKAKRKAERD